MQMPRVLRVVAFDETTRQGFLHIETDEGVTGAGLASSHLLVEKKAVPYETAFQSKPRVLNV